MKRRFLWLRLIAALYITGILGGGLYLFQSMIASRYESADVTHRLCMERTYNPMPPVDFNALEAARRACFRLRAEQQQFSRLQMLGDAFLIAFVVALATLPITAYLIAMSRWVWLGRIGRQRPPK